MIYAFENFELDTLKAELRQNGAPVAMEPQVHALLLLLVENAERLVSRDEIIEKIWDGRIVSDAALSSRIKSLRAALGDDGNAQRLIKTVHGRGFRFVAATRSKAAPSGGGGAAERAEFEETTLLAAKPSIVVLPFSFLSADDAYASLGDALSAEIISELSRLRWLFVIARGTAFRYRGPAPDLGEIGRALGVKYCLTGAASLVGSRMTISVELAATADARVIWADRLTSHTDDIHELREQIIRHVISALEIHIPAHEAQAARLQAPDRLDAWSTYHLGLQHLYRFNSADNISAEELFRRAIILDPDFARAHAALSSAHFQNAFLGFRKDRSAEALAARRAAERSVELDGLDPFANFTLGRVHWIENNVAASDGWLDRAVALCPNYAQGLYARAWAAAITGDHPEKDAHIDLAMALSPFDPFRYGMLGVRAFNLLAAGDIAGAAQWADDAARAPSAHALIEAIAVGMHSANGNDARASYWAGRVKKRRPDLTQAAFFEAFPFEKSEIRRIMSKGLRRFGI